MSVFSPKKRAEIAVKHTCSLLILGLGLFAFGCGGGDRLPVYRVRGKVLYRGQPTAGAFITFHAPSDDPKRKVTPRAPVAADGTFVLTTYAREDGAPAGDYAVTVEWNKPQVPRDGYEAEPGPSLLPPRYQKPETSGLRATVPAQSGVIELPPFELNR